MPKFDKIFWLIFGGNLTMTTLEITQFYFRHSILALILVPINFGCAMCVLDVELRKEQ